MSESNSPQTTEAQISEFERQRLLGKLRRHQQACDLIRRTLRIGKVAEVLARYDGDDDLVVVADGFGGAWVEEVEGNYPIDFFTHHCRQFPTEELALEFAECLDEGTAEWRPGD